MYSFIQVSETTYHVPSHLLSFPRIVPADLSTRSLPHLLANCSLSFVSAKVSLSLESFPGFSIGEVRRSCYAVSQLRPLLAHYHPLSPLAEPLSYFIIIVGLVVFPSRIFAPQGQGLHNNIPSTQYSVQRGVGTQYLMNE